MEVFLLYLLLLALVVYAVVWMRTSGPVGVDRARIESIPDVGSATAVYARSQDLLAERWRMAGASAHATRELELPPWYYDEIEDWQFECMEREGLPVNGEVLTRGQANDVLGLMASPTDEEVTVLRALGEPTTGLSFTAARQRLAIMLLAPEECQRWEGLPATPLQREFHRLAREPVPSELTAGAAKRYIAERSRVSQDLSRDWALFLRVYDDINLRRSDYHLGPVSASLLGEAVELLRQRNGRTMQQIARNLELVVDRLLDLDPELELD
jgi:hypothetical protein